jgi:hypothetical protein
MIDKAGELIWGCTQERLSGTIRTQFGGIASASLTMIVSILDFLGQQNMETVTLTTNRAIHESTNPKSDQIFSIQNEAVFWDRFYQWQENHLQFIIEAESLYQECGYGREDAALNRCQPFDIGIDNAMNIESYEFHHNHLKVFQLTPKKYVVIEKVSDVIRLIAYSGVSERDAMNVVDTLSALTN